MADARADIQPAPLVPHKPKKIQRQDVTDRHDHHEQTGRCNVEPSVEDAEIGGNDGERNHELQNKESGLRKWVKDRDEAVNAVERKGGYRSDIAG